MAISKLQIPALVWLITGAILCLLVDELMKGQSDIRSLPGKLDPVVIPVAPVQPATNTASPSVGKTRVWRHDGSTLKTLSDFCTWTLPLDCVAMKTASGPMPIYIHRLADDVYVSGAIAKTGSWEPSKMETIFSEFANYPDAGFVDVGSHIGSYSLQAAKQGRHVIAIDPLVENVQRLCKSAQRNGFTKRLTIVFNPLSDERNLATFRKFSDNVGGTRVLTTNSTPAATADACDPPVPTYTVLLDELLPLATFKTAILKVDAEEHEYHVINGGQKFLQNIHVPAIFMEWDNVKKTPTGKPLVDLMKKLKYIPYSPYDKKIPLKNEDYMKWPYDVIWFKR